MIMVEYDRSQGQHRPSHYQPPPPHRGSPHLQHMEHPSPHMTPSPTFSYAQPSMPLLSQGRPGGVTSYPSPSSHPSPSMSDYYPPSHRDSPTYSPAMLPSLSLPPIRLNPPGGGPTSSPVPQHVQLGSPLPPPAPALPGYYQPIPPPMQHGHITSSPAQMPSRYPLPAVVGQERIMSGGRHKKEIKRRTKTGCLTCRKRRIKCDEAHPTCKNCQKSKRECLGYDPIFKPQPGPPPIQPAPSSVPQSIAPAGYPMHNTSVPMGYGHHHPHAPPPPPPHPHGHALSTTASSPGSSAYDPYEPPYPVIDPALESSTLPPPPPHSPAIGERMIGDANGYRPDLKRRLDRGSPFSSASDTPRTGGSPIPRSSTPGASNYGHYRDDQSQSGNPAKRIKIDDLLTIAPPPPTPPPSENLYVNAVDQMKSLFKSKYAPALDKFFETDWFGKQGLSQVLSNNAVAEVLSSIYDRVKGGEPALNGEEGALKAKGGLEGEILLNVMRLLYGGLENVKQDNPDSESEHELDSASALAWERVKIVKALVLNTHLDPTRRSKSPSPKSATSNEEQQPKEMSSPVFWEYLREFLEIRDSKSKDAEEALAKAQKHIGFDSGSREILFAIARERHIDAMITHNSKNNLAVDSEQKNLLRDLRTFIDNMSRSYWDEHTCVFRRICGRALAIWGDEAQTIPE